eukprot:11174731-Lingulodinium_polyedra.AAC.1
MTYESGDGDTESLHRQQLALLAWHIERSQFLCNAAEDPLEAPMPKGKKRRRAISFMVKDRVAQVAGEGGMGRTPPA